jgi:nicotinamidase-related amidase
VPAHSVSSTLRDEAIGPDFVHLCVDMQRLFADGTEWALEWMPRVLPDIVRICEHCAAHTIFTRFIPVRRPGEGHGVWRRYYERWASMTIERIGPDMVDLAPDLQRFVPPAEMVDKPVYSPWLGSDLHQRLRAKNCCTLIVTGGETDMCVLATVLGAADYGYRTIIIQDALCSASDEAHDAMLELFSKRYGQHLETTTVEEILDRLPK